MLLAVGASAQVTNNYLFSVNQAIPDGSFSGLSLAANVAGVDGHIVQVSVDLDVTGGFNGDLYAYLVAPGGGLAVLLNRPGVTNGNPFGYSNAGLNITLDDSGGNYNVHYYQNHNPGYSGQQLIGNWAADGENVDPLSLAVGSTSPTATLASLAGSTPNGQWVFFIADLSGGSQGTLVSVGINVVTIPEPTPWQMALVGSSLLLLIRNWRRK
jgi:subtilisin-like proprotein convertase family protein